MRQIALVVAALCCCAATGTSSPVRTLAGRYTEHLRDLDGDDRDNVMEIVPVDSDHAYINMALYFPNGFSCGLAGVAKAEGDALVYRAPEKTDTGRLCALSVRRKGADMLLDDGDDSCKDYCGTNAAFYGTTLPWKSMRPITYITKLKRSSNYRDAMTEWRAGKRVH
ncbi:hypothetical protein [Sphingomonas oryzagri]